jgi:hypothetical protein
VGNHPNVLKFLYIAISSWLRPRKSSMCKHKLACTQSSCFPIVLKRLFFIEEWSTYKEMYTINIQFGEPVYKYIPMKPSPLSMPQTFSSILKASFCLLYYHYFLFNCLFIYSYKHTLFGSYLPPDPHPLTLPSWPPCFQQNLFCPLLQFC